MPSSAPFARLGDWLGVLGASARAFVPFVAKPSRAERRLVAVRWMMIGLVGALARFVATFHASLGALYDLIGAAAAYNAAVQMLAIPRWGEDSRLGRCTVVVDALPVVASVAITGGADSPRFAATYLSATTVAFRFGPRGGLGCRCS
ncbi:MAG: hypothetical protein FJ029_14300 [Actinobacteria bacterium]|nr:hypothetical protein [Actinomycetota bacterium]